MKTITLSGDSRKLLGMVFGPQDGEAWVSWLSNMHGGRADAVAVPADQDTYFSIAMMGAGAHTRELLSAISVHALVLDDVGTKLDLDAMQMLAPAPDWRLETSPGNWQWGYVIAGGCTVAEYDEARKAMRGNPVWGHSDGADAVHLFRLPQGINSKGGREFPVTTIRFPTGNSPRDIHTLSTALSSGGSAGGSAGAPANAKFTWQLPLEALEALVDIIPNDPTTSRDDWIAVMHGILGAGGGFELFDRWSAKWPGYDPAHTQTAWDTAGSSGVRSGGGGLRAMAEALVPDEFDKWRQRWEAPAVFDDGEDVAAAAGGAPAGAVGVDAVQLSVADSIVRGLGGSMRFNHDNSSWHVFSGGVWKMMPARHKEGFLQSERWARNNAPGLPRGAYKEVMKAGFHDGVENVLRQRLSIRQVDFDRDPWLLGTPGGTVDLRTGVLRPALASDFISKVTAVTPGGGCPLWLKFVAEITQGNLEAQRFLQQWLGYNLCGDITQQVFVFLYGPGGNGKSVLMDTAAGIMGDYFRKPVADLYFAKASSRHMQEVAMLAGARMITVSEVPPNASWDEGKLKDHTGGGAITANFMRENSFTFVPQFKLTALGNHQPTFPGGMNDAIKRRFKLLPLDWKPAVVDLDLGLKLMGEWGGILSWMISGLCDPVWGWRTTKLMVPKIVDDATSAYVNSQDHFGMWLDERVEKASGSKVGATELFQDWTEWKHANGSPDLYNNQTVFASEINLKGISKTHMRTGNVFIDIRLKSKAKSVF